MLSFGNNNLRDAMKQSVRCVRQREVGLVEKLDQIDPLKNLPALIAPVTQSGDKSIRTQLNTNLSTNPLTDCATFVTSIQVTGTTLLQTKRFILSRSIFRPDFKGFTLIELLVVVVILGVVLSLIALNLQGSESQRASDEQALVALMENARDHAASEGVPVAVSFSLAGEPIVREKGTDGAWVATDQIATPAARFQVRELRLEGKSVSISRPVVFMPEGLILPFDLTLAGAGSANEGVSGNFAVISGDRLSRISLRASQ
jgi:general secretion pathway protein H